MIGSLELGDLLLVLAVGVGHDQRVLLLRRRALGADERDARRERAADPGELLEDDVGDPVRHRTQRAGRRREALPGEALAVEHVVQLELRRVAIAAVRRQLADDDEVALQIAPVLEADLIAGGRPVDHVLAIQRRETAAALQVGGDDLRDVEGRRVGGLPAERHDGDRHGVLLAARDLDDELRVRQLARPAPRPRRSASNLTNLQHSLPPTPDYPLSATASNLPAA